jgi:hypothetical protein
MKVGISLHDAQPVCHDLTDWRLNERRLSIHCQYRETTTNPTPHNSFDETASKSSMVAVNVIPREAFQEKQVT